MKAKLAMKTASAPVSKAAQRPGARVARAINQILRDSYRTHARDRVTRQAVKHCLG